MTRELRQSNPWAGAATLLLAMATVLAGCTYERVVRDPWAAYRDLAGSGAADTPSPGTGEDEAGPTEGYAILVATFEGPRRHQAATTLMHRLRRDADLTGLWTRTLGERVHVFRGLYRHPQLPAAREALEQVRNVRLDGGSPYAAATLVDLADLGRPVTSDPIDLAGYPGMYTLQIGFYDERFGPEFRQAAEDAARSLRQEGEPAYFYHGPHRSMVTVGLFTAQQAFVRGEQGQDVYAPTVRELQEKYPYNLGNGRVLRQKFGGEEAGRQRSSLVRVN